MLHKIKKIFELDAATGILLILASIAALFIANSQNFTIYYDFLAIELPLNLNYIGVYKSLTLLEWINDGLMAVFFFLIGLELKEEVLAGELSSKEKATLPAIAALGGVIVPALIFYFFNANHPQNLSGFAIPTATDIAFAYGAICLFGKRVSRPLKVFLISLAIFDDLIAILIIAFFYSKNISLSYLGISFLVVAALFLLNFKNSTKIFSYLSLGVVLWVMVLKSGVHPTIAGVALAMFIPHKKEMLKRIIRKISPTVNFFILPIFAFANSGLRIEGFSLETLTTPLVLGVIVGLFVGKQVGVMLFSYLAVKFNLAQMPRNVHGSICWLEFYGVTILTGIGFTMSFFIGSLAFVDNALLFDEVKIGVLCGSFISAIFGILVISFSHWRKRVTTQ